MAHPVPTRGDPQEPQRVEPFEGGEGVLPSGVGEGLRPPARDRDRLERREQLDGHEPEDEQPQAHREEDRQAVADPRSRLGPHAGTSANAGAGSRRTSSESGRRTHATRHQTRMAARIRTAISNAPMGSPPTPVYRPNQENRVRNTATSDASNATNRRRVGRARANQGSSQSPYCGEYTLFVSRNATRRANPNVQRGKSGTTRRRSRYSRIEAATNRVAEATLMRRVCPQ